SESNRLFDSVQQNKNGSDDDRIRAEADWKMVKDLNARAAMLRTLYRTSQVELANFFTAVIGKPGGTVGSAMGSQVRLSIRAQHADQARLVFSQPGEYMDKFHQFFIADFVETWFRAKKEA